MDFGVSPKQGLEPRRQLTLRIGLKALETGKYKRSEIKKNHKKKGCGFNARRDGSKGRDGVSRTQLRTFGGGAKAPKRSQFRRTSNWGEREDPEKGGWKGVRGETKSEWKNGARVIRR